MDIYRKGNETEEPLALEKNSLGVYATVRKKDGDSIILCNGYYY